MRRLPFTAIAILLVPAILACGVLSNALGGDSNYRATAELWSDVPRMDGLTSSELEDLPLPVKLVMRVVLGNLGRLNAQGEDQSTGNIDWISFKSSGTPEDIVNFYTPERMAADGWEQTEGSTCVSGGAEGTPQGGAFCVFGKQQNGLDTYLAIIVTQDESTRQTSAFFLRLESAAPATP